MKIVNQTMRTFENEGLMISVHAAGGKTHILFSGKSDSRDPGALIRRVREEIIKTAGKQPALIDISELEFMNSATVSPILDLLKSFNDAAIDTTMIFDTRKDWQRINFNCMKVIVKKFSCVTVTAGH